MRDPAKRPTLADVARAAGVSPITVSRVVTGRQNVGDVNRRRVEKAVEALGYVPNKSARNLAGGQELVIALLCSKPSPTYLCELLLGALDQANSDGARLIVEHCDELVIASELVSKVKAHHANAVLIPPPLCDNSPLSAELHGAGLAVAQVSSGKPSEFVQSVTIDDAAASHDLAKHLIHLGHKKIGFIAGDPNLAVSALRLEGFETAMSEAGLEVDRQWIVPGDFRYRSGMEAAERLLVLDNMPTAIMASNDKMAAATIAAAHRLGLEVPADVSVCGFGDTSIATNIWPNLTTVRQPIEEMAKTATKMLVRTLQNQAESSERLQHIRLAYQLISRDSVGSAAD